MTLKIVSIVGARPQFIKAAVISRTIAEHAGRGTAVAEEVIHTGQHYDHGMSQVFFDEMEIPQPAVNLGVRAHTHGTMTAGMLVGIEKELLSRAPDRVLVYGDTNTTLAGALAAAKLNLPLAHVEAGLRSFNRRMPEEINRILVDHMSDLLFCPSESARGLLRREGIERGVEVVGDVMVDALLYYRQRAPAPERDGLFALATLHRAENTDDHTRLKNIVAALDAAPIPVVMPLHPRTRKALALAGLEPSDAIEIVEPFSYLEMVGHLSACAFVLTDSGGLQKESYVLGKPCITLRDETEWTELVEAGGSRLVGADRRAIEAAFEWAERPLPRPEPLYGDGTTAQKIIECLIG